MSRHRCPLGGHNNLLQSNLQHCQQRSATFLALCCLLPLPRFTTQSSFANFGPFIDFFQVCSKYLWSFLRTKAENAAECTIQSAALMQIVGIWPVETNVSAAIIFQSKRLEQNQPQPAENMTEPLFVWRTSLRNFAPYPRSPAPVIQTFDSFFVPLCADKKNKTPEAAEQHLHELYRTQRL